MNRAQFVAGGPPALSHLERTVAEEPERVGGDADFTAFALAAVPRLQRSAYLMCRDWHLAEDLTQTTLAKMYASWRRISRAANLEAYSRRVLMHAVFDLKKRRSGSEVVLADLPDRGGIHGDTETQVSLLEALAALPARDRAIVVLRHWEDHSVQTVAEILGISVSMVKKQNASALSRLRDLLGENFSTD